jgi:hypothetical protein
MMRRAWPSIILALVAGGCAEGPLPPDTDAGPADAISGVATATAPDASPADDVASDAPEPADVVDMAPMTCWNGRVDPGELCDPAAPLDGGGCPASCPMLGCMVRELVGAGSCQAQCLVVAVQTACVDHDGCCPTGCNANNDSDCPVVCGNGVLEVGELCDPIGTCPTSCPNERCLLRELVNPGTCQAECRTVGMIKTCNAADGCCPANCNYNGDPDCESLCDNGTLEGDETCDPRVTCPKSCPNIGCMRQALLNADTCKARCVNLDVITACVNGDGCCPPGCKRPMDSDCPGP